MVLFYNKTKDAVETTDNLTKENLTKKCSVVDGNILSNDH